MQDNSIERIIEAAKLPSEEKDLFDNAKKADYEGKKLELRARDLKKECYEKLRTKNYPGSQEQIENRYKYRIASEFRCAMKLKNDAALMYKKIAKQLKDAESRNYCLIIAARCYDKAGSLADIIGEYKIKSEARKNAAMIYSQMEGREDYACYSFLWAAEAEFQLGNNKTSSNLFYFAVYKHYAWIEAIRITNKSRECKIEEQRKKIEEIAKKIGVEIPKPKNEQKTG